MQALQAGELPQLGRKGGTAQRLLLQPQLRHASLRIQGQNSAQTRFRDGRGLAGGQGHAGQQRPAKPVLIQDGQDHLVVVRGRGAPLDGQREFTPGGVAPTPIGRFRRFRKLLFEHADVFARPHHAWSQLRQLIRMEARRGSLVVDPAVRLHPEAQPAPGPARSLRNQEPRARCHRDFADDGHGRAIGRRQHEHGPGRGVFQAGGRGHERGERKGYPRIRALQPVMPEVAVGPVEVEPGGGRVRSRAAGGGHRRGECQEQGDPQQGRAHGLNGKGDWMHTEAPGQGLPIGGWSNPEYMARGLYKVSTRRIRPVKAPVWMRRGPGSRLSRKRSFAGRGLRVLLPYTEGRNHRTRR